MERLETQVYTDFKKVEAVVKSCQTDAHRRTAQNTIKAFLIKHKRTDNVEFAICVLNMLLDLNETIKGTDVSES